MQYAHLGEHCIFHVPFDDAVNVHHAVAVNNRLAGGIRELVGVAVEDSLAVHKGEQLPSLSAIDHPCYGRPAPTAEER